nr:hypothetical protein [Tanacetum cinerariifolium]
GEANSEASPQPEVYRLLSLCLLKYFFYKEDPFKPSIHPASAPRSDDPYVMVRDVAIAAREDDGDDTAAPTDSQPSEPLCRNSIYDCNDICHILIMPPKGMSAIAIKKLVADKVAEVLEVNHATRNNLNVAGGSSGNGEQGGAPPVQECTFTGFMKCDPT